MFIPRTLSETGIGPNPTLWRAVGVACRRGDRPVPHPVRQHHPGPGESRSGPGCRARHSRPPRRHLRLVERDGSRSRGAAAGVQPVTEHLKPPADNQADQLSAFDGRARRVTRILDQRDAEALDVEEVSVASPPMRRRSRSCTERWSPKWPSARWEAWRPRRAARSRRPSPARFARTSCRRAANGARPRHQRPRRRREGPRRRPGRFVRQAERVVNDQLTEGAQPGACERAAGRGGGPGR